MRLSRRTLSTVTVVVIVSVLGASVWWRLRPSGEPPEGGEGGIVVAGDPDSARASSLLNSAFSTDIPQPVTGAKVVRDTLWLSVNAAGRAEAVHRATIKAQVAGVIEQLPVRENSGVEAGQVLLQLEATEHGLAVARAESDLRRARADYQQMVLFGDRIEDAQVKAQREAIARVRSGVDQEEVELRKAQLRFARSRVEAPFEGRVADLEVVGGQHVTVGTELMTVVDLDPIKVEVNVLEVELGLLREGRRASLRFAAFPGDRFEGRIETVNPVVDPERHTGRVTVMLTNPGGRIKPGMYAEVSLAAVSFPDRLLVPRTAILERGEGTRRTMLFVHEGTGGGARAMWRYVATGRENDSLVEIIPSDQGTVEPGEIVLVDGHHYLAHDTPVRLVDDIVVEGGRPGR